MFMDGCGEMMHVSTPSSPRRTAPAMHTLRALRTRLIALALLVMLAACSTVSVDDLRREIVGTWRNVQDYTIEFYADGTGFIPGVGGELPIPATDFTYAISDSGHIRISMGDISDATIEIRIEGDQMTWFNRETDTTFVYMRDK
jgi:hypothetical protein